jgi:hypothetical protein
MLSDRFTEPAPEFVIPEFVSIDGSIVGTAALKREPSAPPSPASLLEVRLAAVWFEIWAWSSMVTMTVRMSPILCAR